MRDVPTVEELHALAAALTPKEPFPARLEVGPVALERIKAAVPPREPQPWEHLSWLSQLTGVPIVTSAELEPDEWRLIDNDGQEMQRGVIS